MELGGYENLLLERSEAVLRVTLNRPDRRNAISLDLMAELHRLLEAVEQDAETRVLVLRGAGKSFCAGYDVSPSDEAAEALDDSTFSPLEKLQSAGVDGDTFDRLWRLPIPTIVQIHGHCLAGGTDLALACDLIICAEDALIGYPAVRSMGVPSTHMWLYHLGPQWTKRLLFSGDSITGAKAAGLGFALEAVPAAALEERVARLAERISWVPRDLLALNKRVVNRGLDLMGRTLLQETATEADMLGRFVPDSKSFTEAIAARGLREAIGERDARFKPEDPLA
jgi:enoyl-CoA hydratase